jgi:hypothetical protein
VLWALVAVDETDPAKASPDRSWLVRRDADGWQRWEQGPDRFFHYGTRLPQLKAGDGTVWLGVKANERIDPALDGSRPMNEAMHVVWFDGSDWATYALGDPTMHFVDDEGALWVVGGRGDRDPDLFIVSPPG